MNVIKIKFTIDNKKYTYQIKNTKIKIYIVPKNYGNITSKTDNGIFISDYGFKVTEQIPSCLAKDMNLVFSGRFYYYNDELQVDEVINTINLTYSESNKEIKK